MLSLRDRNRLAAMRATQREALPLFRELGFDDVTVEEIAERVNISSSTIYRHFGTKEALVLWDEHDAELDQKLDEYLRNRPPLVAIRDAFVESMASRYEADFDFQLSRISFIFSTDALHAAAVEADYRYRYNLTAGLGKVLSRQNRNAAVILAGASLLALGVALDRWQQSAGRDPLADLITGAFADLGHLADLT